MTYSVAIILGFVEGATEFIPVSSSGHLVVAREIFNINDINGLSFDAVLQFSASLALVAYFWRDIWSLIVAFAHFVTGRNLSQKDKTTFLAIILGTIPAVVFGLLLEKQMETIFRNIHLISLTLILGSLLIWLAQKFAKQNKELSLGRGVLVGFFQCLALVPGISRSGATISGGLLSGLSKDEAVRFSFLLSLPILLGSGLKKLFEVRHDLVLEGLNSPVFWGGATAFVVGLFSINFLIKYLKNNNLDLFIYYRIALSIAIFLLF